MKQTTFLVNGFSCLVEGNCATVYVPVNFTQNKKCIMDSANDLTKKNPAAENVARYLVDEGFISGNIPVRIQRTFVANS